MSNTDWRPRLQQLLDDHTTHRREARSSGFRPDRLETARAWHALLVANELAAPGWPKSAGGLELSVEDQLDYYRMTTVAGAPPHPCPVSFIVAPTLIKHGTEQQRERFLQPLLRADEFWCQGFSEPGAGSDLASLNTRAIRDGDIYRVTGQKVWTTMADRADWMFALVRTGPAGRSTEGITYLLIDMKSHGVSVRPLRDISGADHFAEVFFDDVAVPVGNRVGEEGAGWSIMRTSLGHERATAFLADEFKYRRTVDQTFKLIIERGLDTDPLMRQDVARLESGVRAIAANSARALSAVLRGEDPGGVASVNRLVKSEFEQHLHAVALRALGPDAVLGSRAKDAVEGGRWTYGYLMSRATTIGAGTAEIQRNTIAENVLGLPSHRGEGSRPAAVEPGAPLAVADPHEAELRQVLGKALQAHVDVESVLQPARPAEAFDSDAWSALVEFGLPGLAADEALGGSEAPPRLLYVAIEEAARALAAAPLVPSVTALEVAVAAGAEAVARRIAGGEPAAFVVPVDDNGWVLDSPELPAWDGTTLTGVVPLVAGAPVAVVLIVLARADQGGLVLVAVEPGGVGVQVTAHQPLDLTATVGTVTFTGAPGEVFSGDAELAGVLARVRRRATLAVAADSVGVAARAVAMAVDWSLQREQFGRQIGSFQAISHRCADMLVALEGARSQVLHAAESDLDVDDSELTVDLAAASAIDGAVAAAQAAIQIHGGIGFTWEHPAHLLLRRAQSNAAVIGRSESMRQRAAGRILSGVAPQPAHR